MSVGLKMHQFRLFENASIEAKWRCRAVGVGEVSGRRRQADQGSMRSFMRLPLLPGRWVSGQRVSCGVDTVGAAVDDGGGWSLWNITLSAASADRLAKNALRNAKTIRKMPISVAPCLVTKQESYRECLLSAGNVSPVESRRTEFFGSHIHRDLAFPTGLRRGG